MEKITSILEQYVVPFSEKLSRNKYLKAITNGFGVLLPVSMIGAIFTLLANLNIEAYQSFITSIGLKPILAFPPTVTTDITALYAAFGIGKAMCDSHGRKEDASMAGIITLFVFLLLTPLGSSVTSSTGEAIAVSGVIAISNLGASGLFAAMILGLVVPTIYCKLLDMNLQIKMPEQVPPTISKSFSALIPGLIIALVFSFVKYGFTLTTYGSFNNFIYALLRAPLASLGASPFTFIFFIFLCSVLWFFGIHGGMVVMPFLTMLYTQVGLENLQAMGAGLEPTNAITQASWALFAQLGGCGGTIGLCIFMAFLAKSQRYKTIGRLALPANLCGINEPVTFGVPMVLNTTLAIPFFLTPVVTFTIAYLCTVSGIVPCPNGVGVALGTPVILSGFIGCGWQASVLQVVLIAVQFLMYYPFIKVLDKKALQEEQGE